MSRKDLVYVAVIAVVVVAVALAVTVYQSKLRAALKL